MEENLEKPLWKHRLKQLRLGPPFHYEPHYAALSAVISAITTTILYYHLPSGWENSEFAAWLSSALSSRIPAIQALETIENIDINYWKSFATVHFSLLPLHFLLGIVSGFFIDTPFEKKYEKISTKQFFAIHFILIASIAYVACFPLINLNPPYRFYIDQLSDFFPKLLISWFLPAGLLYLSGHLTTIALQKNRPKKFRTA
jgi:hypothetical protein